MDPGANKIAELNRFVATLLNKRQPDGGLGQPRDGE
jgi:hypothetical protein